MSYVESHIDFLRHSILEILVAATLFIVPAGIIIITTDAKHFQVEQTLPDGNFLIVFVQVLTTNLSSALFLFAGVVTLGIVTLIGCVVLGVFFGFSINMAVGTLGVKYVIAQTWLYTPFEIYGFILAGASGLVVARHIFILGERPLHAFRNARSQSFSLLIQSVAVLTISAVLEAVVTL